MRINSFLGTAVLSAALAGCGGAGAGSAASTAQAKAPIDHIIVIYQENHSFDNYFGTFPGAEGLGQASSISTQVDTDGKPFDFLPPPTNSNVKDGTPQTAVIDTGLKPLPPDTRFPQLPNQPFEIDKYVPYDKMTGDMVHRYYQEQMQIDGGKMDKFAAISDGAGLAMGYYDGSKLPLWTYAQQYVLADHFFHAAFGGSFLNHFWLACACSPTFPDAPADMVAQVDANGNLVKDGAVTPDGFGVNTMFTMNAPHPASAKPETLVPLQTMPHIGDRLDEKGISWAWYSGGWNDALAGQPDPLFQFHHQVFAFFKNLADGTEAKTKHLKDEQDFLTALKGSELPGVVFVKPIGEDNEHPGYADPARGDQHAVDLVKAVQASQYWQHSAIIITYDEHGGSWDHLAPPKVDRWGPGVRVPTLIISPYAKKGFVDKTVYDTTSILRFIEWRWGLKPLTDRDAKVNNLTNAFDFSQKP